MSANDLETVLEENAVLRRECGRIAAKCDKAREERDQAIRERDEARRLACGALASGGWDVFAEPDDSGANRGRDLLMRDQADERKWDCFREPTK